MHIKNLAVIKINLNLYIEKVMFSNNFDDESYISTMPVVKRLLEKKELKFDKPVTFIVGENGTGKSTLLEAITFAQDLTLKAVREILNFQRNLRNLPYINI